MRPLPPRTYHALYRWLAPCVQRLGRLIERVERTNLAVTDPQFAAAARGALESMQQVMTICFDRSCGRMPDPDEAVPPPHGETTGMRPRIVG